MAEAAASGNAENKESYRRIFEYSFLDNIKFLEGWKKIVDIVAENQLSNAYLKAQVYFYSKEVEQVDLEGYKKWLDDNNKQLTVPDAETLRAVGHTEASSNMAESLGDTTEGQAGRHPISFAELIAMDHNGIPLPDTEGLGVEPTNEEPSSPVMQRPRKPWEINVN